MKRFPLLLAVLAFGAALGPVPEMATYAASKAFQLRLAQALPEIADLLEPLGKGALGDGFAHLGHDHVNLCHA